MRTLELTLVRHQFTQDSTIGSLYMNNQLICFTLEDKDRNLFNCHTIEQIKSVKEYGKTAIPYGKYKVVLAYSNKFGQAMPLISNIKGFSNVLIHKGNRPEETLGCILIGMNYGKDIIYQSTKAFERLYPIICRYCRDMEGVTLTITREYSHNINL
jgi:hypothetical protein